MDEYTNNLHARIDNILSEIKNSPHTSLTPARSTNNKLSESFDFSTENSVCWLIIGILVGCVVCYCFSAIFDNHNDKQKNH